MVERRRLAILLSTFNGEAFLSEQLDSILQQSFTDFIIVARDDGSADRTPGILTRYAAEHAGRLFILPDEGSNLGAKASFAALMQYVLEHKSELGLKRAYMMFADQDDIWAANKIEIEFKSLLLLETGDGYRMPALVHSDLEVVDFEGKRIAASYIAYQGLQRQRDSLVNQVQSNLVTGCTAVINEELALKALPIPDQAIMHDWWIAIAAVAYGRRLFIDQCLVRYRQHGRNTIGAKPFVAAAPAAKSLWGKLRAYRTNPHLFAVAEQSRAVLRHHGGALSLRHRLGLQLLGCVNVRSGLLQILLFRLARYF